MEKFPQTASHLNANASIVASAIFESAIVKLSEGNAKSNLTDAEKTAIGDLGGMAVIQLDSSEMSFAEQILDNKRRKVAESDFKQSGTFIQRGEANFGGPTKGNQPASS